MTTRSGVAVRVLMLPALSGVVTRSGGEVPHGHTLLLLLALCVFVHGVEAVLPVEEWRLLVLRRARARANLRDGLRGEANLPSAAHVLLLVLFLVARGDRCLHLSVMEIRRRAQSVR